MNNLEERNIREELMADPEFQNFLLQRPALTEDSKHTYVVSLINFVRFTGQPFYKTVYELRSIQNDRIENNTIIRFNPNQSKINLLQFEFIDHLQKSGCRNTTIDSYLKCIRAILNALGVILPKAPKLNPRPKDWYLLSKEDIKYVLDVSSLRYKAIINFAAVTGLRAYDLSNLTIKDFMLATQDYHGCSEVEDFLESAPKGMIGFWQLIPHKTQRLNLQCKVCNTPESSDLLLLSLNERLRYFEKRNETEGSDLKIGKNDPLFANRNSQFKGFIKPRYLAFNIANHKHKLISERERALKYRYEQGEISKETYEESMETIPNFHAHGLRKFFITTLAKNRVDARISALMEGHRPPLMTDSNYVNSDFLDESVKEEYLRCIPDLSFEKVEVRFLTSEERRSLEEKIADLTEKNRDIEENIGQYVDKAIEDRLDDVFGDWLVKKGY